MRALVRPLQSGSGALFFPLESPATRAVYVPNNTIGAIRLNLKGREPFGCVEPGADAAQVMRTLRAALLALTQPSSGQPIISEVVTADEVFSHTHPDVPDLIVRFRQISDCSTRASRPPPVACTCRSAADGDAALATTRRAPPSGCRATDARQARCASREHCSTWRPPSSRRSGASHRRF